MDQYEERRTISYGDKIVGSISGVIFGIIFVIGSVILLWWNESRSYTQIEALNQMEQETVILSEAKVDAKNHNKPIWLHGRIEPLKTIVDESFKVTYDGLKLRRQVQMYQWRESKHSETKENLGGSSETVTTYNYNKDWSSYHIDSSSFKIQQGHVNPSSMPYKDATFVTDAKLGEFYLSRDVILNIAPNESYLIDEFVSNQAANHSTFFYIGDDPNNPKIGDIKVKYLVASKGEYSILAKQVDNNLVAYRGLNDLNFLFIKEGQMAAADIFQEEIDFNSMLTWGLRALGLFLMFLGFVLILSPLSAFTSVIPIVGSFVGGATALISFFITVIFGISVIITAWLGARPWVLGVVLIVIIVIVIYFRSKQKQQTEVVVTPPPRRR